MPISIDLGSVRTPSHAANSRGVGAEEQQGDELAPGGDAAGRPEQSEIAPGSGLRLPVAARQRFDTLLQLGRVDGACLLGVGLDGFEPAEPFDVGRHLGEQGATAGVIAGRLAEPGPERVRVPGQSVGVRPGDLGLPQARPDGLAPSDDLGVGVSRPGQDRSRRLRAQVRQRLLRRLPFREARAAELPDQLPGLHIRPGVAHSSGCLRAGCRQVAAAGNQRHASEPDEDRQGEGTGHGFELRKKHRPYHSFRECGNPGRDHGRCRPWPDREQARRPSRGMQ
jgi:hypothetical protein